jgi:DNA-binding GntR family transcriptional regulator
LSASKTEPVDDTLSPLARNVLSAQVKDRLLRSIIEGELPPGSRIIETRIARQLGTSQAPVREALRDLATLGLVEMQAFRGARVREPHIDEMIEAMEVRGELEAIAARTAAVNLSEADMRALRALIVRMRECAEAGDAHSQALANSEFHTLVVRSSGNRTVQRLWEILEPFARTYLTATAPGADLRWLAERHTGIVDALESRDPERAAQQMRIHAREAEEQVREARSGGKVEPDPAAV